MTHHLAGKVAYLLLTGAPARRLHIAPLKHKLQPSYVTATISGLRTIHAPSFGKPVLVSEMGTRGASHAGSWYSASGPTLTAQLDEWLAQVPDELPGIGKIPVPGARAVISPHAGFAYSGPCAAWAYRCLDLSKAKRIFILHPSHHRALSKAALPTLTAYSTPLSSDSLPLDTETIAQLSELTANIHESRRAELYRISYSSNPNQPASFTTMSANVDEAEHSAEMQLPYLHRLLQLKYPDLNPKDYPPLVPIMIGSTAPVVEAAFGRLLAPYIADESNAFIISSDFCHWGSRFSHTFYIRDAPSPAISPLTLPNGVTGSGKIAGAEDAHKSETLSHGTDLHSTSKVASASAKIYESIAHADRACMCAIATGDYLEFQQALKVTGNTICGRHPIGVFMAGVEEVERVREEEGKVADTEEKGRFRFVRYERSNDVVSARDSSVSYVSAFAVI